MAEVKKGTNAGLRLRWTFQDSEVHKVQALSAVDFSRTTKYKVQALCVDFAEMDALLLNYWVSKFVFILWTLMIREVL